MDLMDALRGRRSVRRYLDKPVPKEVLDSLLEAAETAPSAGNLRSRRYVVVTNPTLKKALAMASYSQRHVMQAPVLMVVCADVTHSSKRYGDRGSLYAIQDADAATTCLLLAAHAFGLGCCWNGAFNDDLVKEILDLPEGLLPTAIISIGWPSEVPSAPGGIRQEVVRWET